MQLAANELSLEAIFTFLVGREVVPKVWLECVSWCTENSPKTIGPCVLQVILLPPFISGDSRSLRYLRQQLGCKVIHEMDYTDVLNLISSFKLHAR